MLGGVRGRTSRTAPSCVGKPVAAMHRYATPLYHTESTLPHTALGVGCRCWAADAGLMLMSGEAVRPPRTGERPARAMTIARACCACGGARSRTERPANGDTHNGSLLSQMINLPCRRNTKIIKLILHALTEGKRRGQKHENVDLPKAPMLI